MSGVKGIFITPCDKCGMAPLAGQPTLDRLVSRAERNYENFGKRKGYAVVTGSCHYCEEGVYTIRADIKVGNDSWRTDVDI